MSIETLVNDFILFFPNEINFSHVVTSTSQGASVTWSTGTLMLNTSALSNSTACLEGYLPVYLNQQPCVKITLNAAFSEPKDGLMQTIGLGDSEQGVFVGYDGTRFGMLQHRGGKRQHWVLKISTPCTAAGTITITLNGKAHTLNVVPGMTPMQMMYSIAGHSSPVITDDNVRIYACFDRLTLYTLSSEAFSPTVADNIDFGTSGVTGSLQTIIPGAPATSIWTYKEQFNSITSDTINKLVMTDMNVFEFIFSRWSSGPIHLSVLNSINDGMDELHLWTPGAVGFNTSLPYQPTITIQNSSSMNSAASGLQCTIPSMLKSSMATVSSGTPSTSTNYTSYTYTFSRTSTTVSSDTNTVLGMMTVPKATATRRNYQVASINAVRVNVETPRNIRLKIIVNGTINTLNPTVSHLPWSCLRRAVPQDISTSVTGGLQVTSMFLRENSGERAFEPKQLWLAPGNNLTICISAVDDPVVVGSIDVEVQWSET